MVFKQLAGAFGVGGPSVETVLAAPHARPGEQLTGEVHVRGGDHDVHIHQVVLSLVTRVEIEQEDGEGSAGLEFHRGAIAGAFMLPAGQHHAIPFRLPTPWELPVTHVYGQPLYGMTLGVRTELEVAGAVDQGDLDPVAVYPLPAQQRVLDAFAGLGFQFKGADLEEGHIAGVHQELPFYQEIEFYPPGDYQGYVNEVELTFLADPGGLMVILEADKQAGLYSEGDDVFGRFRVGHDEALRLPWESELMAWLQAVAERVHGGGHGSHGHIGHGGHGGAHGRHGGPGWGGVAAAGAAGVVGGLMVGMAAGELFGDEGDDADGGGQVDEGGWGEGAVYAAEDTVFQAAYDDGLAQALESAYEQAYEAASEEISWSEED